MGECRFDKDGYCVTPDHATSGMAGPALCGIGKADLKRRVEAFEQLQQAVSVLSANVARLEKEKAQVEREAKEWAEKCVEARLAGHELPLVRKRLEQSEAREAAMLKVVAERIVLWRSHGDVKLGSPYSHLTMTGELEVLRREMVALSPAAIRALREES